MLRSIIILPQLSDGDEIEKFRSVHDPLVRCISAHITLVFPFEAEISASDLSEHVRTVAGKFTAFSLSLGQAEKRDDFVWLPVVKGKKNILELHDHLHQGLLKPFLDNRFHYEPHVTIGRARGDQSETILKEATNLAGRFEAKISEIFIERIQEDDKSIIEERIPLEPSKPGTSVSS